MVVRLVLLLTFVFSSGALRAFEESVVEKVRSWNSPAMDGLTTYGERFGGLVAPSLALFPYIGLSLMPGVQESRALKMWRDAAESYFVSTALVLTLKGAVGRARPYMAQGAWSFEPFSYGNTDYQSFPSGHTSAAFSVATVLSHYSDDWVGKTFFYTTATVAAYSRIYDNKHWLTDVIAGGLLGYFVGRWVVRDSTQIFGSKASKESWLILPGSLAYYRRF